VSEPYKRWYDITNQDCADCYQRDASAERLRRRRRDAASGKAFLTLKAASADAQPREVEVALGLADDVHTEVLSGVAENQQIVEPVLSAKP
jgi:hypothetical protein